ncbi:gluconate 2-dehydrogenase subunit 3 family protein [Hymenobacter sp. HMF4947]|uniref:Gluconate 2-dehydrogenase subunit 3 family protein n=1 Tax=Hymenobacter ginkgonis TaxID=2682976 RepID=A0A7K1TC93_9BACT|nr:gluconate 2-dehydrogenase subunit 3 family protein [Hymenobacter ginkgonis]MVN75942.1 gluconate 2-dehydrogenase subunit 3 family protein [Hymenobacter ginkgonis]
MTFKELLPTDHLSAATRATLVQRLAEAERAPAYEPQFFAPETLRLLEAVAARVFPQPERPVPILLAPAVDRRLAEGRADGWRYDALPPDREAYKLGLGGIQQIAQALFRADFETLAPEKQDAVIEALASGNPPGEVWQTLPADRFFEEILAELTSTYYAHPWAQDEIGYTGYADLPAWTRIGLNEKEPREQPLDTSGGALSLVPTAL